MELTFEGDEEKAQENFRKHGVRFEEGKKATATERRAYEEEN